MSLLTICIVLIVVGVLLWLVNKVIPMEGTIKKILNVVVILFVVFWILKELGAFHYLSQIRI
jgi:hypothetical protein